jgi:hypothetical protein
MSMVEKYYCEDFTQKERCIRASIVSLCCGYFKLWWFEKISTLTELCQCLIEINKHIIYNFIGRLIRLLVTLLVSTINTEHVVSALDKIV